MLRDRAVTPFTKRIYSTLSFGWSGRAKDWQRFEEVSLVLAGLATPLVLSVHTIVSMDFATSVIPGWHTTIFPPYFVARSEERRVGKECRARCSRYRYGQGAY